MNGLQSAPEPEAATASYAFQGDKAASQLSFAAGDPLRVKDKSSPEWWWCINAQNEEGYAPANYVAITPKTELSDDSIFGEKAERRLSMSLGGGDGSEMGNPMMGNPMMGLRKSYTPQGGNAAADAVANQMKMALGGGGLRPSAIGKTVQQEAQEAALAEARAEEQRAAAEQALQAQMAQQQQAQAAQAAMMQQQQAAQVQATQQADQAAAAAQEAEAATAAQAVAVAPPAPVAPVATIKKKRPRNGKFNVLDERTNRRFILDVNSGTFYWAEAGEAEDDDDDEDGEEEPYEPLATAGGAGGGGGEVASQPVIKTISVDEGPVGIKLMNDSRGFTCVLNAGGQAGEKGVVEGDMILAIGGNPLPRGTDHSSIGGIIKSLQRPFPMDFLPANTADPESYHANYAKPTAAARVSQVEPASGAALPPPPISSGGAVAQDYEVNNTAPAPPVADQAAAPASAAVPAEVAAVAAPTPQVAAPYRTVQVTFGDGPMGIDLKVLESTDPLVVALIGPGAQSFGSVAQNVVAIKRTIGQAQALGLQPNDVISAINAVTVPPGTDIPTLKAQIGASSRPITLTLSRATKDLIQKIESAKQKEEAAARAERARQNGTGSGAYGEEDGCVASYFNSGVSSFTQQPESVSISIREICNDPKSFTSIASFDPVAKNMATLNKYGGVVWSKKPMKFPMLDNTPKKNNADAVKCFADIQLYMGDGPKGAGKQGNWVTLMAVLNACSKPDMADEIYCQLIKQTTKNPNPAADCRGWEIMVGCTFVAQPSNGFLLPYLLRHAYNTRLDPTPRGALALRVYQRLLPNEIPKQPGSVREKAGQFTQSTLATIKTAVPPRSIYDAPLNDALRLESITEHPDSDKALSKANEFVFLKKQVSPAGLALLTNVIRKNGGFRTEGLFRLASDAEDVAYFKEAIERGDYRCLRGPVSAESNGGVALPELKDPHVAANLIKIWLRSLPEPIVPFNLYQDALDAGASNDFQLSIRLLQKLPPAHSRTLRHCVALLRELADNENATKMSHANCAMVFAPNVLRSRTNDPMLFARNQENEQRFLKHLIVNATEPYDA